MLYAPGSDYVVRESPYYQFENPTSDGSSKLPLDHFSQTMVHWHFLTNYRPSEKSEEIMIARLIDFMRWTRDTVHEETGRSPKGAFVHNFNSLTLTESRRLHSRSAKRTKAYASESGGCGLNFSCVFNEGSKLGGHSHDISHDKFDSQSSHNLYATEEGEDLYSDWPPKNTSTDLGHSDAQSSVASVAYRNRKGSLIAATLKLPAVRPAKAPTSTNVGTANIITMRVSPSALNGNY